MKKYLLILFVALLGLSSCLKDKDITGVDPYVQFGKDTTLIKEFIATNNIPAVKHTSGIYYQIIEPGAGTVTPTDNSIITVAYKGRLLNGTVFDQSDSLRYTLGNLITGWRIGLPKIKEGGKIRLLIPSGYAYGSTAVGSIPANSVLDFDITLKKVEQ